MNAENENERPQEGEETSGNLKNSKSKRFSPVFVIAFISIAVLSLTAVAVSLNSGFRLDAASAESKLIERSEFEFDAQIADEITPISDSNEPLVFGSLANCQSSVQAKEFLASAMVLASADFNDYPRSIAWFSQDIVEFKDENSVQEFLKLAKTLEGQNGCSGLFNNDPVRYNTTLKGDEIPSVEAEYDDAVSHMESVILVDEYSTFTFANKYTLVSKGKYLLFVVSTVDLSGSAEVSFPEMYEATKTAISKFLQ